MLDAVGTDRVAEFAAGYDFGLDRFQREACEALAEGAGVLVCAPTGAGKTVVGEFAAHLALKTGRKCFYTTPIKALSNQKYADLVARHGSDAIGLLTGDTAVNSNAQVVVMTTEVLRNMLYGESPALQDLGYVVMDEVHYLADRARGAVWEEVIIHLPRDVRLVSLSATVSNAEEFADWLVTVRGDTRVVLEEVRPIPLWQHVLTSNRLYDLFVAPPTHGFNGPNRGPQGGYDGTRDRYRSRPVEAHTGEPREGYSDGPRGTPEHGEVNPTLVRLARDEARLERMGFGTRSRSARGRPIPKGPGGGGSGERAPGRVEAIDTLDREGLLPAIVFTFSRAGCDAAVQQCLRSGLRLSDPAARDEIRAIVEKRTADLGDADLRVLGYWEWLEGLERGIAAHHAGMLPRFKEVVEELFVRGLVKVVFATETLALGINMPARSVVLSALSKWNGETHADITPGEYTQLTGRAGRRGIDVEGHAVVLWTPGLDPEAVAGLASTRTYPLRSSFRPSYNMAVNLVSTVGRERARELLETSFAQFQADRSVVGLARQVRKNREAEAGYRASMECHLGSISEYDDLRRRLANREASLAKAGSAQRRADTRESLEALAVGDVIRVPSGRRAGVAVVIDPGVQVISAHALARGIVGDGPRPLVLAADKQVVRLSQVDFSTPVTTLGRIKIPRTFSAKSPQARKDLASTLRAKGFLGVEDDSPRRGRRGGASEPDVEITRLRAELRAHPVHGCTDRESHLRWAERLTQLRRDTAKLDDRVKARTGSIGVTFDRICRVLDDLGYLSDEGATAAGEQLAGVYAEADLLAAECLRRGLWEGLSAAELAACVSVLVYEPRRPDEAPAVQPPPEVRPVLDAMEGVWGELHTLEASHQLASGSRQMRAGFAWPAHQWAAGHGLEGVLQAIDMPAGDFVRWTRQLIDLLGQLAKIAAPGSSVGRSARQAVDGLRRGIVADVRG